MATTNSTPDSPVAAPDQKPSASTSTSTSSKPKKPAMSKLPLLMVGSLLVGLLIGAGGMYLVTTTQDTDTNSDTTATESTELTNTATYADIEACDILRKKDVEAVLGQAVVASNARFVDEDPNTPPTPTMCVYVNDNVPKPQAGTAPTADFMNTQTILTLQHYNGDLAKTQAEIDRYQAATAGGVEATVEGLGDAAYWNADQTTLTVRKGDTIFSLRLGDPVAENRTLDRTRELAAKVLLRY